MRDPVTLAALAGRIGAAIEGESAVAVTDVTHDSRQVGPGTLFVAIPGSVVDGHDYLSQAVSAGAAAVCVERRGLALGVPALVVPDAREALAPLAAAVHGDPAAELRMVGVTGTNGKTTVTHLLESICRRAGIRVGLIGTVGARIDGEPVPVLRTTPEASDFQRLLRTMADRGVDVAAVEVSSHALALHRVDATRFDLAVFTNLSQDHLDFHGDMAAYEQAKATLFDRCDRAVIWVDDEAGARIAAGAGCPVVRVGTSSSVDVVVGTPDLEFSRSTFELTSRSGPHRVEVGLGGSFNVPNAAVAAAAAEELEIDWASISAGLSAVTAIPGRFELVDIGRPGPTVIVDYAHTPAGISVAIHAARVLLGDEGRVIVVVGAGGDRDRAKRPLMGRAASEADMAVLTSDNPRSEAPEAILSEVAAGALRDVAIEVDRRTAIRRALREAGEGDAVLILGKGHETGQDLGDRIVPFDDRVVVLEEAGVR